MVSYYHTSLHHTTKKYHNSTQNCPLPMSFQPKWPKFRGDSFPDVKRSKIIYIWQVLTNLFDRRKRHFFIPKNLEILQHSSNIKQFWAFDVWKRIPTKFLSFWSKNHWKRTILSRVMILFGFKMVSHG